MGTGNRVVSMYYTLKDDAGSLLDASRAGEPFEYLEGHQNIIPALEKALSGLNAGDKKQIALSPSEGYGDYDPNLSFAVPITQFGGQTPEVGMQIQLSTANGQNFIANVVRIQNNEVVLDANHPLAGKSLHFDIEIAGTREATQEELAHGHPHGPNGHHH